MRENRPYGSEGGGAEFNQPFLPLSLVKVEYLAMSLGAGRSPAILGYVRSIGWPGWPTWTCGPSN